MIIYLLERDNLTKGVAICHYVIMNTSFCGRIKRAGKQCFKALRNKATSGVDNPFVKWDTKERCQQNKKIASTEFNKSNK